MARAGEHSLAAQPAANGHRQNEQTVGGVYFHLIEHEIHHRAFILNKLAKLESGQ